MCRSTVLQAAELEQILHTALDSTCLEKSNLFHESIEQKGETIVKIVVDYAKCVNDHSKICVEICPVSVFVIKKSGKPAVANQENYSVQNM